MAENKIVWDNRGEDYGDGTQEIERIKVCVCESVCVHVWNNKKIGYKQLQNVSNKLAKVNKTDEE